MKYFKYCRKQKKVLVLLFHRKKVTKILDGVKAQLKLAPSPAHNINFQLDFSFSIPRILGEKLT